MIELHVHKIRLKNALGFLYIFAGLRITSVWVATSDATNRKAKPNRTTFSCPRLKSVAAWYQKLKFGLFQCLFIPFDPQKPT